MRDRGTNMKKVENTKDLKGGHFCLFRVEEKRKKWKH